jgi:hypothetical protein
MSSTPLSRIIQNPYPDSDDDAAQDTEDFLASLAYKHNDGYISPDDQPVHITANMMENDDVWMLTAADAFQAEPRTNNTSRNPPSSAAKSEETLDDSLRLRSTTSELETQFLQWERTRLTAHTLPPGDGPRNRVDAVKSMFHNGVSVRRLLTSNPRASSASSAETAKDPYSSPVAKHEDRIYQPG